jgi:hypothetical protein
MHEGFEGWVRVLCAGPLAYAASEAAAVPNIALAAVCAGLAIVFAAWPERMAYWYRNNRPLPFWSKPVSIVGRDAADSDEPTYLFATYRPRLLNLFSAYVSMGCYVVFGFKPWRVPALYTPFLIVACAALLLALLARSES